MKRLFLILSYLSVVIGVKAQVAKWLIQPSYERIQIVEGADAIMTDSLGTKSIWTMDGKKLFSTQDELYPFKEGLALSVKQGSDLISMVYKDNGEGLKLEGCSTAHDYPYYSDGVLLVRKGDYYKYVDGYGNFMRGDFVMAYPYFNMYATCDSYLNAEKQKDIVHYLLDGEGNIVNFVLQDKVVDADDLQFISSVNDEGLGVVVIKQKVYLFNGKDRTLSPVFIDENPTQNLKEQAKLIADIEQSYVQDTDSTHLLITKCGKKGNLSISFDTMRRPISIKRNDSLSLFKAKVEEIRSFKSSLKTVKGDNVFGLVDAQDADKELLPPQFEEIPSCFFNKALVKLNGKYGMLEIYKNESFKLKMNKGDDIAFRHQKFETTLRADFSTMLSADKVSIEIDTQTGCDIDKTSKESKNTESGNFVQYNCVLSIPSDLPDVLTELEYPVTIVYNDLKSSTIPFKVNAWHYKYFVVDVDDSQTTIENGTVSFVFNINAERIASDGVYPTTVNIITTDSLRYEYEKLSEIRHKCKVYSLNEGVNNIIVQILEQGCPPAAFPFEVEYHKPVARTRNKPAEAEKVTIKKKEEPRVIM